MAKIKFSLHPIAVDIRKAQKRLREIRPKVAKADQKKIDLNLRVLERAYQLIESPCPKPRVALELPFGQWFTTKI